MEIVRLFLAFLQVGALSFGGGYAAIPLISRQAIDHYGWMTVADFSDLVTISETTPGPIAVNAATFVGMRVAGIPGALGLSPDSPPISRWPWAISFDCSGKG